MASRVKTTHERRTSAFSVGSPRGFAGSPVNARSAADDSRRGEAKGDAEPDQDQARDQLRTIHRRLGEDGHRERNDQHEHQRAAMAKEAVGERIGEGRRRRVPARGGGPEVGSRELLGHDISRLFTRKRPPRKRAVSGMGSRTGSRPFRWPGRLRR